MDIINRVAKSNVNIEQTNKIRRDLNNGGQAGSGSFVHRSKPSPATQETPFLQNIEPELQKLILKIWGEMNLGLDKAIIERLVNYIKNQQESKLDTGNNPASTVRTFAFLARYNIPLLPSLIRGMEKYINPDYSPASLLEENSPLPDNLSRLLGINPETDPEKISEKLKNYSNNLQQAMKILSGLEDKESGKSLMDFLLGQQSLNLPRSEENNILLSLFLPLILPQKKEPFPLHLQVWQEKNADQENKKSGGQSPLHIDFIIELEKLGTIRNETIISENTLRFRFITDTKMAAELIEEYFTELAVNLQKLGFKSEEPVIKTKEKVEKQIRLIRNMPERETAIKKYTHIDFRA